MHAPGAAARRRPRAGPRPIDDSTEPSPADSALPRPAGRAVLRLISRRHVDYCRTSSAVCPSARV